MEETQSFVAGQLGSEQCVIFAPGMARGPWANMGKIHMFGSERQESACLTGGRNCCNAAELLWGFPPVMSTLPRTQPTQGVRALNPHSHPGCWR